MQNKHKINDKSLDIYQKVLTYEIENNGSSINQLRGTYFPIKLESLCNTLAQHIINISFEKYQVTNMILYFKIDNKDKLWLLQCQSLKIDVVDNQFSEQLPRVQSQHSVKKSEGNPELIMSIPQNIDKYKVNMLKSMNLRLDSKCSSCNKQVDQEGLFEISFRYIIKSWEFDHYGLKQKDKDYKEKL